ncbi:N-terminal EF-hand calcium-binding protein 3, partial [Acanthisitta chloris]
YETSSKMEHGIWKHRPMHQLQSLQASLECAVDTVEEQSGRERKDIKKSETSVSLRSGRRCGRRGQKNVCLSPTDPYSGMLTTGTCSLMSLGLSVPCWSLDWLELLLLQPSTAGSLALHPKPCALASLLLPPSSHGLETAPACSSGRRDAVPACPAPAQGHSCPHSVSACKLTDEACFILYEFWQDVTSWRSHLQSSCSKTFQQSIISLLESPELLTTMLFPASWWIMNNN